MQLGRAVINSTSLSGARHGFALVMPPIEVCSEAPIECMLETKEKDVALLKLRDDFRRNDVIESDLPAPVSSGPR